MTPSLLAALLYCSLIILLFGALIYFLNHIKTRNRYSKPFARPSQDTNWPLYFLRGGGDNPRSAFQAGERFEELLRAVQPRQPRKRQSRPWEARKQR